jgi:hypothetical protein
MGKFTLKILVIGLILVLSAGTAFGQVTIADMEGYFSTFSADVAESLPGVSSTGLTWSDAKVRGFPHFGVGVSLGAVMIPKDAFVTLADSLYIELPTEITDSEIGVPLPAYAVDARVGLPFLPFDVGAKLGMLTPEMSESLGGDISADYMLAGFDLRFPIIKGGLALPSISVSAGYNYLSGGVNTSVSGTGDFLTSISIPTEIIANGATISYTDPDVRFQWQTHAMDFKLQASKGLLIFTPYIGGAYSYGWSQAGGGIASDLTVNSVNDYDLDDVSAALEAAGYDFELDDDSFSILSDATGGSFRAFGGLSVNLFILKLDLNGQYNFTTQSLGGGLNVRIQI